MDIDLNYDGIPIQADLKFEDRLFGDRVVGLDMWVERVRCLSEDPEDVAYIEEFQTEAAEFARRWFEDYQRELEAGI
jgi:hypothetical protein